MFEAMGGRKFIMSLSVIASGIAIGLFGKEGLTPTMAGFLVAMFSAFSAANVVATVNAAPSKTDTDPVPEPEAKIPEPEPVKAVENLPSQELQAPPIDQKMIDELLVRQHNTEQALQTIHNSITSVQKTLLAVFKSGQQL